MNTMERPQLTVLLPVYKEGESLRYLLPLLKEALEKLQVVWEILVVDSMEPMDDTEAVCRTEGLVRYINRQHGNQYGDAIRTGFRKARGEYIVVMDGDGSHHPRFIAELWAFHSSYDLVIASRYVPGGKTENPGLLIFMSLAVNVVFRLVLGLPCYDVSNSYRLYRGDSVRRLELECNNFDVVEEILVRLIQAVPGFKIKEIPVVFERRKAGKSKRNLLVFAMGYLFTLMRLVNLTFRAKSGKN